MKTNTLRHLSDEAHSVKVDRKNTIWEDNESIENVQDILETFNKYAINVIHATDEEYGIVKLARDEDLDNELGSLDVVTSQQLIDYQRRPRADYSDYGTTRYATEDEVFEGASDTTSITPKELGYAWNNMNATTMEYGTIKLSHESMVVPGIDDETAMTPRLVKMAIDKLVPDVATATEKNTGTVILSNIKTTLAGKVREGYAVSPYSFRHSNASEQEFGTVRLANEKEARAGLLREGTAISPYTFHNTQATTTSNGTVKLATELDVDRGVDGEKVVTPRSLSKYISTIKSLTGQVDGLLGFVPIGSVVMSFVIPPQSSGFVLANGRTYNKNTYPEAFNVFGYKHGGSGNNFAVPDMQGLYPRGTGKSKHIKGSLGNISGGGSVGTVQAQQVRRHKHVGGWGLDRSDDSFGRSNSWKWCGSGRHDYNNPKYWTNDGSAWDGNPNPDGIIGSETRPWSMSVYFLVRIA